MHNELFEKSDEREEVSLKNAKIFLGVNNPKQHPKDPFFKSESDTKNPPARKKQHRQKKREIFSFFERQTGPILRETFARESF